MLKLIAHMKKLLLILSLVFIFSFKNFSQPNFSHVRISIITCGPGDELYSLFGHTAIRVIDSSTRTDIVYNWGGFTFDQPNFYLKFLRGQLLYYSSAAAFPDFMYEYVYEHRSVYEQVLHIDSATKKRILDAIAINMQGSNRFYKYDFLLDNCTTRVKNIVFENSGGASISTEIIPKETTSRDLIRYYLERGGQPWTELGIDILLGSRVDKVVSNDEAMFLPEFFMKGLGKAEKSNSPFAEETHLLLAGGQPAKPSGNYIPLITLTAASLLIFFVSTLKQKWAKTTLRICDALLLYVTGIIGIIIIFMWFATDHTVCQNNFNLVWALPTNLIAAFCLIRKPLWLNRYFFIAAILTALLLATWFWLPQQFNLALLPVILLLLNRYVSIATASRKA
jgi:hypothetical protein